jgi:acetylserotonin N-methyltransferase
MLYKLWEELETAVLTGTNCWQSAFGLSSSDVFGSLYQNDAAVLRFMQGMDGFSQLSARAVLTAFDLSRFRVLVDWGGATGALAAAACSIYPELKGVVVDLPHVVEKAQQHFSQRPAALVSGTYGHTTSCATYTGGCTSSCLVHLIQA